MGERMMLVKQDCHVYRAMLFGFHRHDEAMHTRHGLWSRELRILVAPPTEWAMRITMIESDVYYRDQYPTMQHGTHDLAAHAQAGLTTA
jgi:hypothetical protein